MFMIGFKHKETIKKHIDSINSEIKSVGFVPTMGALHNGHLSLVKKSQAENDVTVVSVFVNPTQFDNLNDLDNYPKTLEKDLSLLKAVNCDIVFSPNAEEMYGDNKVSESFDFGGIEQQMEGAFRPGHFDGVGTIVKHLFNIINPTRAYFGEKDFQQLQIIKKLVEIEHFQTKVIGCPIHRESNGLAMSSRNQRLSKNEQKDAGFIFETLTKIKESYSKDSIDELNQSVIKAFKNHPALKLEYFTIADESSLKTINKKEINQTPRAFIAAFIGSVRLIDNLALY